MNKELLKQAEDVLNKNWQGSPARHRGAKSASGAGYTVPALQLYPHQWSWDSCFHAIGWSHLNMERAWQELDSLFNYQWEDGMVPHIVFHKERGEYFPDSSFWQTGRKTSALIQPPMHAVACWYLFDLSRDKDKAKQYLFHLYEHLLSWHRYLLEHRDPEGSGLITMFHPWETGLDNSPRWDEPLSRIEIDEAIMPKYERVDIKKVEDPRSRPTDEEYDKYIYLVELYRAANWDAKQFYKQSPFLIKDVVASSIFYAANLYLKRIARVLGKDESEVGSWLDLTRANFFKYFCPDEAEGLFYDYDLKQKKCLKARTAAAFIPLYSGLLTSEQARGLSDWLSHAQFCGTGVCQHPLVPSAALEHKPGQQPPGLEAVGYWRGPIWVNLNWLIYKGLLNYQFEGQAQVIRKSMLELVSENGFYEYYDPYTGRGLGAKDFSWSAALTIDFIRD